MHNWITYILEVNVYLIIIGLSYQLSFKKIKNFAFGRPFLLIGTSLSLLIPFLKFPDLSQQLNDFMSTSTILNTITIESNSTVPFNYSLILASVLILGGTFHFLKLLLNLLKLNKVFNSAINRNGIFYLPNSTAAFSFFNQILIGEDIPIQKKEIIINHEKVHAKKLHSIDILFLKLVQIAFWYNPIVNLISGSLKELHEFEADHLQQSNLKEYLEILIQQNFDTYELSFIHQFNSNHLKNRIMRIKNQTKKSVSKVSLLFTLIAFMATMLFSQNIDLRAQSYPIDLSGLSSLSELSKLNQLNINTTNGENKKEAQFPGGQKAFIDFMIKNIKYPEEAKKENISGTVFIEFTIDENGKCKNLNVLKGVSDGIDEEALKVLRSMPDWEPAELDGKKIASTQTVPVKFQLPKK